MTQRKRTSVISEIITLFSCLGGGGVVERLVSAGLVILLATVVPRSNLRPHLWGQLVCLRPVGILNHVIFHLNYYYHYSISISVYVLYYY